MQGLQAELQASRAAHADMSHTAGALRQQLEELSAAASAGVEERGALRQQLADAERSLLTARCATGTLDC